MPFVTIKYNADLTTQRDHARLMRDLLDEGARDHLRVTMERHFQTGAAERYHYKRRTARYIKQKLKKVGADIPLVYTGRMHRELQRSSRVTATQDRSRIYFRNYFPMQDFLRQEVEIVLVDEQRAFARRLRDQYIQRIVRRKRAPKKS